MGNTITYKKIFKVLKTENFFQKSQLICLLRKAIFKVLKSAKFFKKVAQAHDFLTFFCLQKCRAKGTVHKCLQKFRSGYVVKVTSFGRVKRQISNSGIFFCKNRDHFCPIMLNFWKIQFLANFWKIWRKMTPILQKKFTIWDLTFLPSQTKVTFTTGT